MKQRLRRLFYFGFLIPMLLTQPCWAYSIELLDKTISTDSWWAQTVADEAATSSIPKMKKSLKDPGVAIGLATFPGIVVQGSGHFYAGRPVTATFLLLAEAGAVYMTYRGASDVYNIVNENLNEEKSEIEIIESLSDTSQLSHGIGLAVGGLVLFLSSWLYDATGAPIVVEEENARIQKDEGPKINARLTLNGIELEFGQLF